VRAGVQEWLTEQRQPQHRVDDEGRGGREPLDARADRPHGLSPGRFRRLAATGVVQA